MKKFLIFLFALVFPVVFVMWWMCAIVWQLTKHLFLLIKKEFITVRKEFNGSNISKRRKIPRSN